MIATAKLVSWYEKERLHSWCRRRPPLEFKQDYWLSAPEQPPAAA
jgi:transposase InsO family protein